MVTILAGRFKNRRLKTPSGTRTRPTSGIVRKSVFDRLQPRIEGARLLDLFAGSGAMGIEAFSRGASSVVFVESDRAALSCIESNLALLELTSESMLLRQDILKALEFLKKRGSRFDVIYADPPYAFDMNSLMEAIDQADLLAPEGILFLEIGRSSIYPPKEFSNLKWESERRYGDSLVLSYQKR